MLSIISEFTVNPPSSNIANAQEKRIYAATQPAANHDGGQLLFGQDGYLYIFFGDGGISLYELYANFDRKWRCLGSELEIANGKDSQNQR